MSVFTTCRFSFSDVQPGTRRSNRAAATSIRPSRRAVRIYSVRATSRTSNVSITSSSCTSW